MPDVRALRAKIAAIEAGGRGVGETLPFGAAGLDGFLPGGGLPLGRWHELAGEGLEMETAAAPAAFAALMAAPLARRGQAVWVLRRDDLYAPGLVGLGFPAERLIQVCARDEAEALSVTEDALATAGVAAVFCETDAVDLVAGRRLQLACERRGATGFVIRRRPYGGGEGRATGSAAATRWRIAAEPGAPAEFGLGAPRWRAVLERCRGGRPGAWILEASTAFDPLAWEQAHGTHPLRLVAELGDRQLAPAQPLRLSA
ncbi:ImuA family protein [Phenylobacterium sp.]|uniref:ImuA family protein n=1 Tax=Phenylobacterium sp. TaxID=1871053 RepID=UPI0035B1FD07